MENIFIEQRNNWSIEKKKVITLSDEKKAKIRKERDELSRKLPGEWLYDTPCPRIEQTIIKSYTHPDKIYPINSLTFYQIKDEETGKLMKQKIGIVFNNNLIKKEFVESYGEAVLKEKNEFLKSFINKLKKEEIIFDAGKKEACFKVLNKLNKAAPFSEPMKDDLALFLSVNKEDTKNISTIRNQLFNSPVLTLFFLAKKAVVTNPTGYHFDLNNLNGDVKNHLSIT